MIERGFIECRGVDLVGTSYVSCVVCHVSFVVSCVVSDVVPCGIMRRREE